MAQVNIATIDAMLEAIDDELAANRPPGGYADAGVLTSLTGRVSDAEMAIGDRALVTALNSEVQARTDAVSALQTAVNARIPTIEKGAASGVATLGVDGKIPANQLPALATTETFVVGSQTEQLALAAQPGDFAVRTDFAPHRNYILTTSDPANFNNWRQLSAPGAVTSVDGMTGAVTLGSTSVVSNTLARRKPTGALAVAAAQVDGEAVELAQLNAALSARDLRLTDLEGVDADLRLSLLEANLGPAIIAGGEAVQYLAGVSDGSVDSTWNGLRVWYNGVSVTVSGAIKALAAWASLQQIAMLPPGVPLPTAPVQANNAFVIRVDGTIRTIPAQASGYVASFSTTYAV